MNLTCFYCQTPFTLSMDQKIAALRKMHAENLHHYDAHCPRCGRANAISRERLEMFTPGWEEAIKEPVAATAGAAAGAMPAGTERANTAAPAEEPATAPAPRMKRSTPARKRHTASAKKVASKGAAKKAPAKKAATKKKTAAKSKKTASKKTSSRKTAKKKTR